MPASSLKGSRMPASSNRESGWHTLNEKRRWGAAPIQRLRSHTPSHAAEHPPPPANKPSLGTWHLHSQPAPNHTAKPALTPANRSPFFTSCGSGALASSGVCGQIRFLLIGSPGVRLMEQATTSNPTTMYIF